MIISKIMSSFQKKIGNNEQIEKRKILRIKDIVFLPEFENMLAMDEGVVELITNSIRTEGFKAGHELHIWLHDGKYILIDGYTRIHCCILAGLKDVPCIIHTEFNDIDEAKQFAFSEQRNRRNLKESEMMEFISKMDFTKGKGNIGEIKGKTSEIIGKQLGVSSRTVEKVRFVLKEANEEQKNAIKNEELSVNQVYKQLREKNTPNKSDKPQKNNSKEKAFVNGILYAIIQLNKGIDLKNLYSQSADHLNYDEICKSIDDFDFSMFV